MKSYGVTIQMNSSKYVGAEPFKKKKLSLLINVFDVIFFFYIY